MSVLSFVHPGPNKLQMIRMAATRASLLLRVHAIYRMRADRAFTEWTETFEPVKRDGWFRDYLMWSKKAATMATRHRRLFARVLSWGDR